MRLTKTEEKVMHILWEAGRPLSIMDLRDLHPELNRNTLQAVLKNLLDKGLLHIAGSTSSKKVPARLYIPACTRTDYELMGLHHADPMAAAAFLVGEISDPKQLEKLRTLIEEKL